MMKRHPRRDYWPLVILSGILFVVISLAVISVEDGLPMLVYLPVVCLLASILFVKGIKPIDADFQASWFTLAFVWKLISTVIFYWLVLDVYTEGDANRYHKEAQYVSQLITQSDFSELDDYSFGSQGTTNIVYLAGVLYAFLPASRQGGGLFFATLAFAGGVFFYRAFRLAFPDTRPALYRTCVFFVPSILFWSSAVSKEAWIIFGSGFVAYGLAQYVRQTRLSGLLLAIFGLVLVYLARPHFASFMVLAMGGAYLLSFRAGSVRRLLVWLLGASILMGLGIFLLRSAGEFLRLGDISDISGQDVVEYYHFVQQYSSMGGSSFVPQSAVSLVGSVSGFVTVLFRPFPWEAHNLQSMATSMESVVWFGLLCFRRRILWARLRSIRKDPWVAFALGYCIIMIMALTTIGNFGIVARQRVVVLPFLFALLG
jgi:hypothetical protein